MSQTFIELKTEHQSGAAFAALNEFIRFDLGTHIHISWGFS